MCHPVSQPPYTPAHVRASFPPGRRTGRVLRPSLVVASYMVLCRPLATLVPACPVMAATLHPPRLHRAAPLPTTVPYTRTAPSLRSRCDAWLAAVLTPLGLRARACVSCSVNKREHRAAQQPAVREPNHVQRDVCAEPMPRLHQPACECRCHAMLRRCGVLHPRAHGLLGPCW